MNLDRAFVNFFTGDYQTAAQLFGALSSHSPYAEYHHTLAQFLGGESTVLDGIPTRILISEALRQETCFQYDKALHLWTVVSSPQQKKVLLTRNLAICDINAKIKPLSEVPLHLIEEAYSDASPELFPLVVQRLLSIVKQLVDNNSVDALPRNLVEFVANFLHKFLSVRASINSYSDVGYFYFLLGDYEKSSFFYSQAEALYGLTPSLLHRKSELAFQLNHPCQAITWLEEAINLDPDSPHYLIEYAIALESYGRTEQAQELILRAFRLVNLRVHYLITIANSYRRFALVKLASKFYYSVIALTGLYKTICYYLASLSYSINEVEEAKNYCKLSMTAVPINSGCVILLSDMLEKVGKLEESVNLLEQVYSQYCYSYDFTRKLVEKLYKSGKPIRAIEICRDFLDVCSSAFKFRCLTVLADLYLDLGISIPLLQTLDEIQEALAEHSYRQDSWQEWMSLYHNLTFIVPSVRDDPFFNCLLFSLVSEKYLTKLEEWRRAICQLYDISLEYKRRFKQDIERIAFISPNFRGHVVSVLSIDVISELALLEKDLEVMIIPTDANCKESKFMKDVRKKSHIEVVDLENYNLASIVATLAKLDLDVLIELDGATAISACAILYCRPAVVNISWLGFDAPFISPNNYFLCDHYTHPPEFDEIYTEQLVRLPHSHMCIGGFQVEQKDRNEVRKSLGISQDQTVFIYTAAVRKFNFDTAAAHAQILKRIPKSVLLVKTSLGLLDQPLTVWQEELQSAGVAVDRIIPIKKVPTQEEHRFYFKVADIYLDAYPYNGGSQTLEALWCELPVVTLCGQQSFARMGYSLLSTLGITDGIAHSWEEYVEWAVRLATDKDLYQKIKHRLWEAKQPETLSPLWNPKQFARDMYNILQDLYAQEVQKRQG